MSSFLRSLGNLAGGVAGGYLAGAQSKRQQQTADMQKQMFDQQGDYYKAMADLVKQYHGTPLGSAVGPGGVPTQSAPMGPATGAVQQSGAQANGTVTAPLPAAAPITGRPIRSVGSLAMPELQKMPEENY